MAASVAGKGSLQTATKNWLRIPILWPSGSPARAAASSVLAASFGVVGLLFDPHPRPQRGSLLRHRSL